MARFNKPNRPQVERTHTFEGGSAVVPPDRHQLLFTAVSTYLGEDTFYETAAQRAERISNLVHTMVANGQEAAVRQVAMDLRGKYKIRTAAIFLAAEYARAGGPHVRSMVSSVLQRPDEPGELLSYWMSTYGRKIPRGIKTGINDVLPRLYTPRNVIKYDTASHSMRFADVIQLTHPKPEPEQRELHQFLLNARYGKAEGAPDMIAQYATILNMAPSARRDFLRSRPDAFRSAGMTWENLSSWLPDGMDAEAWQFAVQHMGVMALLRNLRNFDQARMSDTWIDRVIERITDKEEVAKSRIMPYQVLMAYMNAPSDDWKRALRHTLDLASGNVPSINDSVLLIDTSGSMQAPLSKRSQATCIAVASLQAMSVFAHSEDCRVVLFGQTSADITDDIRNMPILKASQAIQGSIGAVGHSTYGWTAAMNHIGDRKRVVMFTDDQQRDSDPGRSVIPSALTFNIGGYAPVSSWGPGRMSVTGFSDAIFHVAADLLVSQG